VRQKAAEALGALGPAAKEATPALVKALKDDDLDARYAAGQALKAIDPETAKKRWSVARRSNPAPRRTRPHLGWSRPVTRRLGGRTVLQYTAGYKFVAGGAHAHVLDFPQAST
jgi:hypothetical protein